MVLGARCDGAEVGTAPPEEVGEAEALVEPAPTLAGAPEVRQIGGGTAEASPIDVAMARTSKPEVLASSAIGGSAPKGVLVTKEVLSAPIGPMPMVAAVDPSVGARPSWSLVWPGNDPLMWGGN